MTPTTPISTSPSISKGICLAVLITLCSLALASVAWAHDDDYYRNDAEGHYAYQNGYRDGLRHGTFDRTEQHRYNIHSQQ